MDRDEARETALTEAAFRIANERMARWDERHQRGRKEPYYCECALADCRATIKLDKDAYERVRAHVERFIVVPGHVVPELETVIAEGDGFEVIEKPRSMHGVLAEAHPRRPETGPATAETERLADSLELDQIDDD